MSYVKEDREQNFQQTDRSEHVAPRHSPCTEPGRRRVKWETDESSRLSLGDGNAHGFGRGTLVHWPGVAKHKSVLVLSLESVESLDSGVSSGNPDRCIPKSHPHRST